jgi:hypothetical protein
MPFDQHGLDMRRDIGLIERVVDLVAGVPPPAVLYAKIGRIISMLGKR